MIGNSQRSRREILRGWVGAGVGGEHGWASERAMTGHWGYQIGVKMKEESSRLPSARVCDFSAEIPSCLGKKWRVRTLEHTVSASQK